MTNNSGKKATGKASLITVLAVGGAYASYQIGAGSASGQEALQYFVSYGSKWALTMPILVGVFIFIYCWLVFRRADSFNTPQEAYEFYCGKWLGKVVDILSTILIAGIGLGLYSGCGSSLKLYFGLSEYVGAIILGVIAFVTVILGLEKLVNILGVCGVLIFAGMAIVAVMALINPLSDIETTDAMMPELLEEGTVLKATMLGIDSPIVSTFNYTGITLLTAFPFLYALAERLKNKGELIGGSVTSGIFFAGTIYVGGVIGLLSLAKLVEIDGLQLPNLAACKLMFPGFSYVVLAVLVVAIYSSIAGYTWVVGRRFAKDGSWQQKAIYVAMALIGIFTGSFIPFNQVVNFIFPIAGLVGLIIFVGIIVREIQYAGKEFPVVHKGPKTIAEDAE